MVGMGDKKPVEGIPVVQGKAVQGIDVIHSDRK